MTARVCTLVTAWRIDPELAAEMEKLGAWVSSHVRDIRVDAGGSCVRFSIDGDSDLEAEHAKVARFVADMTERHRPLPSAVVARRAGPERAIQSDVFTELVHRGWVVETARGRAALRGPALSVVRALDEDCARVARDVFGAVDEAHPSLASTSLLARCGWFASFPHAASLVAHFAEDYDAIDAFRRANAHASELVQPAPGTLAPFDACLLPALCYSVYAAREATYLPSGLTVVTCAGRCFRYESRNLAGVERLWEFGMREIVFLGDPDAVASARRRALDAVLEQLERWDLDGTFETANDPFFAAVRPRGAHWQRSGERKIELRMPVAAGPKTVACASLNLHDRVFGSTFAISHDGAPATTGCVGWGMERWMLACFARHGFDPRNWPQWLGNRLFQ